MSKFLDYQPDNLSDFVEKNESVRVSDYNSVKDALIKCQQELDQLKRTIGIANKSDPVIMQIALEDCRESYQSVTKKYNGEKTKYAELEKKFEELQYKHKELLDRASKNEQKISILNKNIKNLKDQIRLRKNKQKSRKILSWHAK